MAKTTPISLLNEANNVLTNFRIYPGMNVYELKWKNLGYALPPISYQRNA